ncbi:uncharacterized protein LOC144107006 [Amblyomma americanum]
MRLPVVFSSSILLLPLFCLTEATLLPLLFAKKILRNAASRGVSNTNHVGHNEGSEDADLQWQPSISFESVRDNRNRNNNFAVQVVREQAPLIRQIEIQINEGLEAERNLTAVRAAIRRELAEAKKTGSVRGSFRMERQLQQLDDRLAGLRAKNKEAEIRFRNFVGGIDSGRIRSQRQARAELGGIAQFCSQVVMKYVNVCVSLCAGIINFYKNIFVRIANIFHGILGFKKLRSVQAGVNLIAGI